MKNKLNKLFILGLGITLIPANVFALEKRENVYEVLNKDGSRNNIIVTNKLIYSGEKEIIDETQLRDILNISGDEEFELKKNNLTWKNANKEIVYQGTTDKKSPIESTITYKLDGKEIDVNELNGKKGNIEITIKFTNNESHVVHGNKLYTPYVTSVATMLDNNTKDISISNGKVVTSGNSNILVAVASPGLYKSIGLSDLKDLDKVTIKYYTESFEFKDIYVVSSPKVLSETDMDIFKKLDELTSNINKLQTNMDKIEKASNTINDGTANLNKYLKEIKAGISKLSDGSDKVADGMETAYNGLDLATKKLSSEITEEKINQLKTLRETDKQTIASITTKLETTVNGADIDQTYVNLLTMGQGTCPSAYEDFCTNYQLLQLLKANYQSVDSEINLITTLPNQLNELKTGLNEIKKGTKEISTNMKTVKSGINSIYDGSTELKNGMNQLNTGIETFNKEGINTLTEYSKKIDEYSTKFEDLIMLSKNYNGFATDSADETMYITVIK